MRRGRGRCSLIPCCTSWDGTLETLIHVELEYSINQQRVDYALMGRKTPVAVIEAKALGKPLDEKETMQALNYANTAGIPYMTLTNGDHWRMLEVFKQAPMKDRILMNFQLTQDEPYACALQALGLWRPTFGEWGAEGSGDASNDRKTRTRRNIDESTGACVA